MASRRKTRSGLSESFTGIFFDNFQRNCGLFFLLHQLDTSPNVTRSGRKSKPPERNRDYILGSQAKTTPSKASNLNKSSESNDSSISSLEQDDCFKDHSVANNDVAGSQVYQINTPKKAGAMKRKAENTPKSPATILSRLSLNSPKTPRIKAIAALQTQNFATPAETRDRNKKALTKAKQLREESESESSADEHSDYEAGEASDSDTSDDGNANSEETSSDDDDFEEPKQMASKRNAASKQKSVELPRAGVATRGRPKKKQIEEDFIPDSDNYFLTTANKKVLRLSN